MRPLCSAISGSISSRRWVRSLASVPLVLPHQPAVARDIGGENGREPPFDPLSAQNLLPVGGLNSQSAPRTAEEQPDAGAPRG